MTDRLKEKFVTYNKENPDIYEKFKELAFIAASHRKNFAARAIFHIIRWDSMVTGKDAFKVNNDYSAYYSRKFMTEFPEHSSLFRTRGV
jgi:hypothetical protein